jgi:hypothetical protein
MCVEIEAGVGGTAMAYSGPHVLWSRDNGLPAVDPDQYIHVELQLEFETWQSGLANGKRNIQVTR